jgi:hypothetical protein
MKTGCNDNKNGEEASAAAAQRVKKIVHAA